MISDGPIFLQNQWSRQCDKAYEYGIKVKKLLLNILQLRIVYDIF